MEKPEPKYANQTIKDLGITEKADCAVLRGTFMPSIGRELVGIN